MSLPKKAEIEQAAACVYRVFGPTPDRVWPLISRQVGTDVRVKHENHTPIGSFKLRGGLWYMESVDSDVVISATRGNHGQSVAYAATRSGKRSVIVVPEGNSREKNAAMEAFGGELVVCGHDFQAAYEYAQDRASGDRLHLVPSFHERLVAGVATYSLEFLSAHPGLDVLYVPIGLGSGICGAVAAREALGLRTEIVGVVAETAATYALSFSAGQVVSTNTADTMADGMACRVPDPDALEIILAHVSRVVAVSDDEIESAMRSYFSGTHNVIEGAGAASLAALIQERRRVSGLAVGIIASGGNVDRDVYCRVLSTP
ncbi:MAG: threonine dehydratase [Paracoccaceae bacterium]|nr:threonine dehydratase [Paracoccaceae bacterium]